MNNINKIWYGAYGATATGKTTLLKYISSRDKKYKYVSTDYILTEGTTLNKYLKKVHEEKDYSYYIKFQMRMLPLRFELYEYCEEYSLVDETIYDTLAYTIALKNLNWLTDDEFEIFKSNFQFYNKYIVQPKALIYLSCKNRELILKRLQKRGRNIERKYTYEYIDALLYSFEEVARNYLSCKVLEYNIECFTLEEIYNHIIYKL